MTTWYSYTVQTKDFGTVKGAINLTYAQRDGLGYNSSFAAYGNYVDTIKLLMRKTGSPTGNATIGIRDSSDVLQVSTTLDVSTLTASYAWYTFKITRTLLNFTGKFTIEYSGASGGTAIYVGADTGNLSSVLENYEYYSGAWNDEGTGPGRDLMDISIIDSLQGIEDDAVFIDTTGNTIGHGVSDPAAFTDLVVKSIGKQVKEIPVLTDLIIALKTRGTLDQATIQEAIKKSINKAVSDSLVISEVVHPSKFIQTIVDNLQATDIVTKLIAKKIVENPTLVDTLVKTITKLVPEVVTIHDTVLKTFGKQVADQLFFAETVQLTGIPTLSVIGVSLPSNSQIIVKLSR